MYGVYCDPMVLIIPITIGVGCWLIDITDAIVIWFKTHGNKKEA